MNPNEIAKHVKSVIGVDVPDTVAFDVFDSMRKYANDYKKAYNAGLYRLKKYCRDKRYGTQFVCSKVHGRITLAKLIKRIVDKRVATVLSLRLKGYTMARIAKRFNVTTQAIASTLETGINIVRKYCEAYNISIGDIELTQLRKWDN